MGGAGSSVAASAVRASASAALRSPRRSASQPRIARPTASRLLSPVARACAIDASSSGRTWPYRSAQSSASVARENHVGEREPRPVRPSPPCAASGQKRPGRELRADLGGLVREDGVNAATASSSGGAAGSSAARSRNVSATEGGRRCGRRSRSSPATTAAASSGSASSEWLELERRRRTIENLDRLGEALSAAERVRQHHRCLGGSRRRPARRPRPPADARASRRARRSPRPFRARAAVPTGRPAAAVRRALGGGRRPPTRERPAARAARAASTSRATTQPSAAGSLTSRCSATRSFAPGCSASSSAARRWPCARSAPESSA